MADNTLTTLRAALEALVKSTGELHRYYSSPTDMQLIGNHNAVKDLTTLIASMEAQPEPESFEQWNAKQHGDPEEIGFLQALRIAYCCGQDSVIKAQPSEPKAEPARLTADERQGFIAAIADRDSIIKALLGQSVEKAIESKIRGDV